MRIALQVKLVIDLIRCGNFSDKLIEASNSMTALKRLHSIDRHQPDYLSLQNRLLIVFRSVDCHLPRTGKGLPKKPIPTINVGI